MAMPSSDSAEISSLERLMSKADGPAMMPTAMKLPISG